jgi:ABC-2 type transport system permease protein
MVALAAVPVVMAAVFTADGPADLSGFDTAVLGTMLAGSITPLVALAMASAAFGNEVEDQTLANLTLAPIPRWRIVLPKLLASVTMAAPFTVASGLVATAIVVGADLRALTAVGVAVLVEVVLYSMVFLWLGLVTTRAIGFGLAYVVVWEALFAQFVTGVRFLSIRYHTIALMQALDGRRFAESATVGSAFAIVAAVVVVVGFFLLAVRRLRRMDVP